jgi:acetyl-CoA carboxylase carboxyltransferase component
MSAAGAVNIVHRREIMESDDPAATREALTRHYEEHYANPYVAAERGYVDAVIEPNETRRVLAQSLALLRSKREETPKRKHGNIPL